MPTPALINAVNHVAIVTQDLDRFIEFYQGVLGIELVFREDAVTLRHAILRTGALSWLHPVEVSGSDHGMASDQPFQRGHLDHLALTATSPESFSELRRRLMARGASTGAVDDLGAFQTLWFRDPDGMSVELTHITDPMLHGIHTPVPGTAVREPSLSIERQTDRAHWPLVDRLLRDYVPWVVERLALDHGIRFDDADQEMELHHAAFAAETSQLLAGRGRLFLARLNGRVVGLVALKPVDSSVGEVKRLYVSPAARGHGIGRALLERLLIDARVEGYRTLRLETLGFMSEARTLYRAFGFAEVAPFTDAQAAMSHIDGVVRFMALAIPAANETSVTA